jgi:hypothetical protein
VARITLHVVSVHASTLPTAFGKKRTQDFHLLFSVHWCCLSLRSSLPAVLLCAAADVSHAAEAQ